MDAWLLQALAALQMAPLPDTTHQSISLLGIITASPSDEAGPCLASKPVSFPADPCASNSLLCAWHQLWVLNLLFNQVAFLYNA